MIEEEIDVPSVLKARPCCLYFSSKIVQTFEQRRRVTPRDAGGQEPLVAVSQGRSRTPPCHQPLLQSVGCKWLSGFLT